MNIINNVTENDLIIVARSSRNRKETVDPIAIKNGIYFYVGFNLDCGTGFLPNPTPAQIYRAKENTVKNARLGGLEVVFSEGATLADYEYTGDLMIIVSSVSKVNAAGILYCEEFFKEAKKKFGDFFVLPSSIHEVIIVPVNEETTKAFLTETVNAVNATEVINSEYLAGRAFEVGEWI